MELAVSKKCTKCGEVKALGEFYKGRAQCKACGLALHREWRKNNQEKAREYGRNRYKENRDKERERKLKYYNENPEKARERKLKYYNENPEKAREHARKYRSRKFGHEIPSEGPHWSTVGPRDNWTCHLCGETVQDHWDGSHAKAPTVDHIIPISLGGPDTFANVKLAHFGCNAGRGAKPLEEIAAE